MKIIFSKKGFDNTYGKVPSPVFDKEGTKFISMPIPAVNACDEIKYSKIEYHGHNLGDLVEKLKGKKVDGGELSKCSLCHFDPQLVQNENKEVEKSENWKPILGQADAAQGHLFNQKIGKDALFLFYGRFRRIDENNEEKMFSAIYGWLQVEECVDLIKDKKGNDLTKDDKAKIGKDNPCIAEHPHFNWQPTTKNNSLYIAKDFLDIGQTNTKIKGAGLFDKLYILTESKIKGTETNAENRNLDKLEFLSISNWILPICLFPDDEGKVTLTCNKKYRWKKNENDADTCKLSAYGRFQEFVLNYDNAAQETKVAIETWVKNLFV